MCSHSTHQILSSTAAQDHLSLEDVRHLVSHAAHYLPAQGPITAFVHHNTLHSFEDLPFEQALEKSHQIYGSEPYLSEERYRQELDQGRIQMRDLEQVLKDELGEMQEQTIAGLVNRYDLALKMLVDPIPFANDSEIQWLISTGDGMRNFHQRSSNQLRRQMLAETRQWLMRDFRIAQPQQTAQRHLKGLSEDIFSRWDQSKIESWSTKTWEEVTLTLLWRICRQGMHGLATHIPETNKHLSLAHVLLKRTGHNIDLWVNEQVIRFCVAFTDQGLAEWELPGREKGFLNAFFELQKRLPGPQEAWLKNLKDWRHRIQNLALKPEEIILECLRELGILPEHYDTFILQNLLALRGWAGMLWQLESRPDRVLHPVPEGTLIEYLALRLVLEQTAGEHLLRSQLQENLSLGHYYQQACAHISHQNALKSSLSQEQRAYLLFSLAQSMGWSLQHLEALTKTQWQELIDELEGFSELKRRKLFHRAYERRFRTRVFDALSAYGTTQTTPSVEPPDLQVVFCIDEREESLRRHLEELYPGTETFAFAGFFGVPMYYKGLWDAHQMPLCPVVIRPKHLVLERATSQDQARHARGASTLRRIGLASYGFQRGSHGFLMGLATTLLGSLAALPLVARVLFPRMASRVKKQADQWVRQTIHTELQLEHKEDQTPTEPDALQLGFSVEEMTAIVEAVLRNMGMTQSFAKIVMIMGHGSSSLNNPHEAAHDCGACGGGRGGPNARAFAQMANHPEVRSRLQAAGLTIPADTYFVGAYHNTCDDSFEYYDSERIPASLQAAYQQSLDAVAHACEHHAQERARRFHSADLFIRPDEAMKHMQQRAEDLAQPRPEYGHATNAMLVVGRRTRTRGLYMDRRSFLLSYDPECERDNPESPILTRILQAAIPVCAGINLEYYFSNVDPTGWGCGTKLPHNITALLGVMDGAASDLRTGLPWQMVEIHEPVRLVTVIETSPEQLSHILATNPAIDRLCQNDWICLATLDPDSAQIHVFDKGDFHLYQPESTVLPETESSYHWYGGLREHLDFARIRPTVSQVRAV